MDGVGQAAAVAQLVAYVVKLIFTIVGLAGTARRNKLECEELARRVSVIGEVLPRLKQQEPWEAAPLAGLRDALLEAHGLVDGCCCCQRKRDRLRALVGADRHAELFREVNCRIDRQLNLIPLLNHISVVTRLEEIVTRLEEITTSQAQLPLPPKQKQTLAGSGGSKPGAASSSDDGVVKKMTWAEITAATGNWATVVGGGRGSSSTVYRGRLPPPDGREVAVKRLGKHGLRAMDDAFVAEFEALYSVRHGHVVRLVGWCADADERRAFVYDHAANGTLRDHLRIMSPSSPVSATWRARVEALLGAARAVDHLHRRGVIHRDVSSSSILLDARWAPRLAGFGAAVFRATAAGHAHERQAVSEVVGAPGYLDPEYHRTGLVGPASDVYSYGVVMLEALTGRPPVEAPGGGSGCWDSDPVTLVESALDEHGKLRADVLDARPAPEKKMTEALELVAYTAERCLWPTAEVRPAMSAVVANLEKALGMMIRA